MLSIASVFLYALLNNKVLLIHETDDLVDIFCEPFPGTSWVIPKDFPIKDLQNFHRGNQQSYGEMLGKHSISNNATIPMESLPPFVYAHLRYDYTHLDRLFYCSDDQSVLRKSTKMNSAGCFRTERPFSTTWTVPFPPEQYGVGNDHQISRIISSQGQGESGGSNSNLFVGAIPSDGLFDQIIRLLREDEEDVLRALDRDGETVGVYQPTHEGQQQTEKQSHNQKALAEIWLLSFSDVLITTAASTFGYVSSDLAGVKPWVLSAPENRKAPTSLATGLCRAGTNDPPARYDSSARKARAVSCSEPAEPPCSQSPTNLDCEVKRVIDAATLAPYVRHSEDVSLEGTNNALLLVHDKGAGEASFATVAEPNDKLLGGLLSPNFDVQSCLSRYQSILYRNPSRHILSSYLISKLRKYESLHKKMRSGNSAFPKIPRTAETQP
uniref:Fucosyltransferase n=1 Tax=Ananas comosus var. bracteatus TaxID=296719 RepID=A0A6V7P879_ANACO|nr:unnamed protein product [Ananas comosus var. bracteatus]